MAHFTRIQRSWGSHLYGKMKWAQGVKNVVFCTISYAVLLVYSENLPASEHKSRQQGNSFTHRQNFRYWLSLLELWSYQIRLDRFVIYNMRGPNRKGTGISQMYWLLFYLVSGGYSHLWYNRLWFIDLKGIVYDIVRPLQPSNKHKMLYSVILCRRNRFPNKKNDWIS